MATWHQQRSPVRLYSATHWVVVIDPPNECRNCYLASTQEAAERYLENLALNQPRLAKHSYILRPTGKK
jgi:hypothetical protein